MNLPPAVSAALTPLLGWCVAGAFALGLSAGGGAAWWLQGVRIDAGRNELAELELGNREATAEAKEKADTATALIGGLVLDLKTAQGRHEIVRVEVIREIEQVASPAAVCLRASVIRVLNRGAGGAAGEGQGAGLAPAAAAALAAHTGGPQVLRGTSEQAMSTWTAEAQANDAVLRAQITSLAAAIVAMPNVQIVYP